MKSTNSNYFFAGLCWKLQSALFFPVGSPYTQVFRDTILEMQQTGTLEWIRRIWRENTIDHDQKRSCLGDNGLNYKRTVLLFTVLAGGILASIGMLVVEKVFNGRTNLSKLSESS